MEAKVPVQYIEVRCCGKTAPCPKCGRGGRRKQILPSRLVRTIAYKQVVYLRITAAEYYAGCGCCKTFRSHPEEVGPRCLYDNRVRDAVIARIVEDGMDVQRLRNAMKRDFFLDLSEGFVYDCLHDKVKQLKMAEYRQWVREHFSGTLCVDELHLGRYTLLLATDPLGDFPVAFALVDKNDQPHMRRFLQNLKRQVPKLAKALQMLDDVRFPKMIAFLKSPAAKRMRTNNHVQRTNRKLRYYEKVRYEWRQRRSIVRFLLLAIDRWWREHRSSPPKPGRATSKPHDHQPTATDRPVRSKRVAGTAYNLSG